MPVTVAVDATPLLGRRTGIGVAVEGLLRAVPADGRTRLVGFGMTGTGWRRIPAVLPPGAAAGRGPMPAAVVQRLWARVDGPAVQWWTGPVDVVHGTNFVVPPARRAARLVTVYDLTAVRYPELCTPAARRWPELVRRAVGGGAHVHTGTRFVAEEVRRHFGVDADRVHVVAWGVAPPAAAPAPPVADPPYVLGLGTVEPRKDFPLLVRAFERLAPRRPGLVLRIVGAPGWGSEALDAAVERSPVRDRIRREGWVADPGSLLAGASVFAFPSVYEGFGFPPLEAMALGVPVVATAAGAVPEVVGAAADLVAPGDADALADALERVLADADHAGRLRAAGLARAAEFSWAAAGTAIQELYLRLAG